jgi:3-hydroxyisobutyrate dehydrogenase
MKIAVIGTGLMGAALAEALLNASHDVIVWNRSPAKLIPLQTIGAVIADSAGQAITTADVSLLVLSDAASVAAVLFDPETTGTLRGQRLINVATVSPDEIENLAREVSAFGGSLAEVTVIAYPNQVRDQEAQFVLGCPNEDEELWQDVFGSIGTTVMRCGDVGDAARGDLAFAATYVFNVTAAAYTAAMGSLLGVPEAIIEHQLTSSPAITVTGANQLLSQIFARKYEESLASIDTVKMALEMALPQAQKIGIPTKILEGFLEIYTDASDRGYGSKDIASVFEVLVNPTTANS